MRLYGTERQTDRQARRIMQPIGRPHNNNVIILDAIIDAKATLPSTEQPVVVMHVDVMDATVSNHPDQRGQLPRPLSAPSSP